MARHGMWTIWQTCRADPSGEYYPTAGYEGTAPGPAPSLQLVLHIGAEWRGCIAHPRTWSLSVRWGDISGTTKHVARGEAKTIDAAVEAAETACRELLDHRVRELLEGIYSRRRVQCIYRLVDGEPEPFASDFQLGLYNHDWLEATDYKQFVIVSHGYFEGLCHSHITPFPGGFCGSTADPVLAAKCGPWFEEVKP